MSQGWITTKVQRLLDWAQASSLRYFSVNVGCCADELFQTESCRYDMERFGALPEADPLFADLLIVSGAVSVRLAPELKKVYDKMPHPRYVMAIGSCACSGGAFGPDATGGITLAGISKVLPVDVFVPGCPPRPEAILEGLIRLQEKIRGTRLMIRRPTRRQNRVDRLQADEWDLR
ncbi:MAG: NADH-quinone oxidoreductase subunit B [Oligoflexia bacterium]